MTEKILLIDNENVPNVDPAAIPDDVRVFYFFGASQRKVTRDFLRSAVKLGSRFVQVDVESQAKDALGFHLAFYLGELLGKTAKAECVILSKDGDYVPLVKHLLVRKFDVRRASTLAEAYPVAKSRAKAVSAQPVDVDQVVHFLSATEKKKRPHKREALITHIAHHFKTRGVSSPDAEAFVAELLATRRIAEGSGKVTYNF